MYESIVFCSACTMSSVRKFTFAISSSDEFLVLIATVILFCDRVDFGRVDFVINHLKGAG